MRNDMVRIFAERPRSRDAKSRKGRTPRDPDLRAGQESLRRRHVRHWRGKDRSDNPAPQRSWCLMASG